jgi:hypothetical protein
MAAKLAPPFPFCCFQNRMGFAPPHALFFSMIKKQNSLVDEIPIPEPGAPGDNSYDKMMHALGEAVQGWSELEEMLASLFFGFAGAAKGGSGAMAALRAFGAIEAFYMKRKMVQAAATVFFLSHAEGGIRDGSDNMIQKWPVILNAYLNRCEKLASIRNNIVHGKLFQDADSKALFIGPPYHDSRYKLEGDPEFAFRYSSADLQKFAKAFRYTPWSIRRLGAGLMETEGPWPEKPQVSTSADSQSDAG